MGISIRLVKSKEPTALSLAKSNSIVTALMPNCLYEKYRLRRVGIKPIKSPTKKVILKTFLDLNKW